MKYLYLYLFLFLIVTSCATNEHQIQLLQEQNKLLLELVKSKISAEKEQDKDVEPIKEQDKDVEPIKEQDSTEEQIIVVTAPKRKQMLSQQEFKKVKVKTDKLGNLTFRYNSDGFYQISADEIDQNWSIKTEIFTTNNKNPPEFVYFSYSNNIFNGYGDSISGIRIIKIILTKGKELPIAITLKVTF